MYQQISPLNVFVLVILSLNVKVSFISPVKLGEAVMAWLKETLSLNGFEKFILQDTAIVRFPISKAALPDKGIMRL